jgi:hypothetical protein
MAFNQFPSKGGIPSGNTAARPSGPVIGDTYYNGQLEILEIYNGTTWVAASAPPSTPQITSVTDTSTGDVYTSTAGKLAVVFQAGSGGGTPSQYNAFTVSGGYSASSSSTTVTLTGLTPGTSYEVYGNGQNNFGTTVNTPNQAAVTPTTLPQVPTIGTATASTSVNQITVTWTNGSNGGKNLSAITITPFLNGTTAQTSRTAATTSSTSYTFTEGQLTGNASYTFKIKATNANGTCADSTASNSATMPDFIQVQYVIVAGGGGGGGGENNPAGDGAGGGGGGGQITNTIGMNRGTYSIEIGSGGAGQPGSPGSFTYADNGNLSRIHQGGTTVYSLSTPGGGGGGGNDGEGQSGGCGGGDSGDGSGSGGSGSVGFAGGAPGANRSGGGGGGMSAVGTVAGGGGNGGAGVTEPIKSIGVCGGGRGGRGGNVTQVGTGATSFGGGSGGNDGDPGSANTGGGGGGARSGPYAGGNGGSGRIILKSLAQASATTGSPTATTSGSYYIYDFTATGSITWS